MSVKERVKQFILENFYVTDPSEIGDDTSLINTGYVDSTGMLELMAFLEKEYAIRITDTEATPENLETIDRIMRFVALKQAAAAP
jgi:acyl carrier protein